ncbi:metallophosphoesterase family protein [Actinomadura sp. DC4]|uniref:purple acid phosphatase family protein n=1 Tax=Actinomadura sp. DC4 TaxID=3055069 RepID=UPI0025B01C8A|nr:metallophosphoesterase family protein [Actinomadura sp. DC4]MDN3355821.1 metallophosphoesterase family protein [Actinomadura sp. DC4]
MTERGSSGGISRRRLLGGLGGLAVASPLLARAGTAALVTTPQEAGAPAPEQLHLQFGPDASSEMAVSWAAPQRVAGPAVRLGRPGYGLGSEFPAEERVYTDVLTGQETFTYHAVLPHLAAGTRHDYQVTHRGAPASPGGSFRTAPRGRSKGFRFTSFGDQCIPARVGRGRGPVTPNAGYVVDAVNGLDPLFHLLNGDLCYANVSDDPPATWRAFFLNNQRSARDRPWMPCLGNHENEIGNGPQGFLSYRTRFALPGNGSREFAGNWYAFTAGPIRVISISNDDVCLQDGGFNTYLRDNLPGYRSKGYDPYIRGYSGGAQKAWLERTLRDAADDDAVDWIVVCMHQVAMSSAHYNGADLGVRREFVPLFDRYGVDLVVAGHEHHFERTFPVRGVLPGASLLTPAPRGTDRAVMDTSHGTVHMTIGGGGQPNTTPRYAFDSPHDGVVLYDVAPGDPLRRHEPLTTTEPAPWSAYRDLRRPYGFAAFDFEPRVPGGFTQIAVTHYGAGLGSPDYRELDRFVLRKPLRRTS